MAEESDEYFRALLANQGKIAESVAGAGGANITSVATYLLQESLIEFTDYQIVLDPAGNSPAAIVSKLFGVVLMKLKTEPNKYTAYQKLLNVLRSKNFEYLADDLEATRGRG